MRPSIIIRTPTRGALTESPMIGVSPAMVNSDDPLGASMLAALRASAYGSHDIEMVKLRAQTAA